MIHISILEHLRHLYKFNLKPVIVDTLDNDDAGRPKTTHFCYCNKAKPKTTIACSECGIKGHNQQTCKERKARNARKAKKIKKLSDDAEYQYPCSQNKNLHAKQENINICENGIETNKKNDIANSKLFDTCYDTQQIYF
jgi:hypothetical protein